MGGGGGGGWSGLHYTAVRNKRNVTGGNQSREKEQQGIVYSLRVYIYIYVYEEKRYKKNAHRRSEIM